MRGIIVASDYAGELGSAMRSGSAAEFDVTGYEVAGKPMIHYPLSVLLQARIRHILVVAKPADIPYFQYLLGGGEQWGIRLSYAMQSAEGVAEALLIAAEFIGAGNVALTLDNQIFDDHLLAAKLEKATLLKKGAYVFACPMRQHPQPLARTDQILELLKQDRHSRFGYAMSGLYFYDNRVATRVRALCASKPQKIDIADLNQTYLDEGSLRVEFFHDTECWMAINSLSAIAAASKLVQDIEKSRNVKLGCLAEVAWRMGFISDAQLLALAAQTTRGGEADYLRALLH